MSKIVSARVKRGLLCAAMASALGLAAPASADPLLFSFTGGNGDGSFILDSSPTPHSAAPGYYSFIDLTEANAPTGIFSPPSGSTAELSFRGFGDGGVSVSDYDEHAASFTFPGEYSGPKLYSGTEANPVFSAGTYALTFNNYGGTLSPETLTIKSAGGPGAPAPEIGGGLLAALAAGAALVLTRLRRRSIMRA